jgi:hypothetical protein
MQSRLLRLPSHLVFLVVDADALTLPGISAPFENMFDPLNLTKAAKPAEIKRWRESELTHGRVAMLAALGFVIGEQLEDFP